MTKAKLHLIQMKAEKKSTYGLWPHLVLALSVLLIGHNVSAQELKTEILKTHQFVNQNGGDIFVTIQRVENVMGTPYQLEIRGGCSNKKFSERTKAPVIHVENFCDLKVSSPKLEKDQLSFTMREVDAERFNKLSQRLDPEKLLQLRPTCLKEPKEVTWSIENFCN